MICEDITRIQSKLKVIQKEHSKELDNLIKEEKETLRNLEKDPVCELLRDYKLKPISFSRYIDQTRVTVIRKGTKQRLSDLSVLNGKLHEIGYVINAITDHNPKGNRMGIHVIKIKYLTKYIKRKKK